MARVLAAAALVVASIAVVPSAPAQATLAGFKSLQGGLGWVDFNGDNRADFCSSYHGSNKVQCAVLNSAGTAFLRIYMKNLDEGESAGRAWADFNGDGRADYCRVVDAGGKAASCTLSNGTSFGTTYTSGKLDPGWSAGGRAWADFNGDGRADYCRVIGTWSQKIQCTLSTGSGFGATYTSGNLDAGWDAGRAWVDVNGDGRADYCRVVGWDEKLQCTLSAGNGFGTTFTSTSLDGGWDVNRAWVDVNGDGRADFCRVVGPPPGLFPADMRCTLSTGNNFGASFTSTSMDLGNSYTRGWADVNGDGRDDFCRQVGNTASCTLSTGSGFGATYSHPSTFDPVTGHGWADLNGDGRADHGKYGNPSTLTHFTGTGWGTTHTVPRPFV